jgi:hypothetical protein
VAGQVTVNWSASTYNLTVGAANACAPHLSTAIPGSISLSDGGVGHWQTSDADIGNQGSLSATAGFDIAADATVTYLLACQDYAEKERWQRRP